MLPPLHLHLGGGRLPLPPFAATPLLKQYILLHAFLPNRPSLRNLDYTMQNCLLPNGLQHAGVVKVGRGHLRSLDGEALVRQSLPHSILSVQVRPSGLRGAGE